MGQSGERAPRGEGRSGCAAGRKREPTFSASRPEGLPRFCCFCWVWVSPFPPWPANHRVTFALFLQKARS